MMSLQSLLDELKVLPDVCVKISAIRAFIMKNSYDYSELNIDELQPLIAGLVDSITIPSDPNGDAVIADKEFLESCQYASLMCTLLRQLARKVAESKQDDSIKFFITCLPQCLKVIALLQREINQWCDKESENIANGTLAELLSLGGCKSVREALDAENMRILKTTLGNILPNLTKAKWKQSCACRSAFIYIIKRSSGDRLAENLDSTFPFILLLTDDFVPKYSVAGIECMTQVLNEVSPSELRLRGRAEVLHDALSKKLYTREAPIAKVLIPCVLQTLNILEPEMMRKRGCCIPKHDHCFDTLLNNFHLSSDAAVRRIYAEGIPSFVSRMGIHSIGHMKTIKIVIEYALDISELSIVRNCAEMVSKLVDAAWPRLAQHCETLLKFLVKALYSIENDEWRTRGVSKRKKTQTTDELVKALAKLSLVSKELVKETADVLECEDVLGLKNYGLQLKKLLRAPA